MTVARQHLRGERLRCQAEPLADEAFHERIDVGVAAHGAADRAGGHHLACAYQPLFGALHRPRPPAELHAHRHGLGVDAVCPAHAEHLARLERPALADLADPPHVGR